VYHELCVLQVSARFSELRQFPGSEAQLEISAAPHSLCALSAVDKSITFLEKTGSRLDVDRMFQDLSRFAIDANSAPLQTDPWEYCARSELNNKPNRVRLSGYRVA
jgi:hypothetical protein